MSNEIYYTNNSLKVFAPRNHDVANLVEGEHPQNSSGIVVRSLFSAENLQYL